MKYLDGLIELKQIKAKIAQDVKPGSSEAWAWLDGWVFRAHSYPRPIQALYNRSVYKAVSECCNEEQLYELLDLISKHDLEAGLLLFIQKRQRKFWDDKFYKKRRIEWELSREPIKQEQLAQQLAEEERLSKIKREEAALRARGDGMWITLERAMDKKVLEEFKDKQGVIYKLYDQTEGYYFGVVTSPTRRDSKGMIEVRNVRGKDKDSVLQRILEMFEEEKQLHEEKTKPLIVIHEYKDIQKMLTKNRINNILFSEAVEALVALGYGTREVKAAITKIMEEKPEATLDEIIKEALKILARNI